MKILLINRFWDSPRVPTARMLADVAKALLESGHGVTVLTSADAYASKSDEKYSLNGVFVIRVKSPGPRLVKWFFFWMAAIIRPLFLRWDACVILTDPPFMNLLAIFDKWFYGSRRKRYWWTMDLFPEALIAGGFVREKSLMNVTFRFINNQSLGALDGVISLDEAQKKRLCLYSRWNMEERFSIVVPPWDYREMKKPSTDNNKFLKLTGLVGRKIVLYAGNIGRAHAFEELICAAKQLLKENNREIVFVFACRGQKRPALENAAKGLSNIFVMDYVPDDMTADMLFAASIHMITLGHAWEGICVPSKLYGILPTQKPVLYIGPERAGTAREILRLKAGLVLPPASNSEMIVNAIKKLLSRPVVRHPALKNTGHRKIAKFITQA